MLTLILFLSLFRSSISQELIVGNLQNQYGTTGQSFHKEWSNNGWNNNLDFAIYGWFKLSSQLFSNNWIVGFHFTSNDNTTWSNGSNLGDRVLTFFIQGYYLQAGTYTTQQNQPNVFNSLTYNTNDMDKWAFIYVACTQSGNTFYSYFQLASSGVVKQQIPNIIHFTSNYYQIYVGYTKYFSNYFGGQICSLYLSAGPNAYTENETTIQQLFNIQPSIALSCSFCQYMNLQLQFQFVFLTCDQNGVSTPQEPLDIQIISSAVPSLTQTQSQLAQSIIQINLKKYQIPLNSDLDILLNSTQTNLTCLQNLQNEWSSQNCQLVNFKGLGQQYCYCQGQKPTTITNDLKSLIQNKNLQTAFSSQGYINITNFSQFYKYALFYILSSVTLLQLGLYLYGQRLDKKQSMYQISQETHFFSSPFMNSNLTQKNEQQQQNEKFYDQNPQNKNNVVDLIQLEQEQGNQLKYNKSSKPKKPHQIIQQIEEIQQLDSLNNEESDDILQNTDKKQDTQFIAMANTNSNFISSINIQTINLIPQQQNSNLIQFQTNNANNIKEPSIAKFEQQQTYLYNNLDKLNNKDQKEMLYAENLDQQSNCGNFIVQDQNTERKNNNNNQQQSLIQNKLPEEDQKIKEQNIIHNNLEKLYQKSFAIKIFLLHDFFNIFYTYDSEMSRSIRFNIFYLRTIHSLCLTTIFDDSYNIYQKIFISVISSLMLVTGVKIITLIHKIYIIGKKLSFIILIGLLVFYYYIILSIISGEEPSYANSKTISFILILGVDFLGISTLVSILKWSLIHLSETYFKKDNFIIIKLFDFLDINVLLQGF
ncbi:hypothetical protein ABPG74_006737, partial [Tetrahymena malaccensis]